MEHPADRLPPDKRARLYQLASAEFAQQGFAQASLNRIIAGAGMSKSSFYHYFQNKADLFHKALDHTLAPFLAAAENFDPGVLDRENFWPFLKAMTREQTLAANRAPELATIGRMFYRSYDNPEEQALVAPLITRSQDWLAQVIRRGQSLGVVRDDLAEALLLSLLMALGTAMDRWSIEHWDDMSEDERLLLGEKSFALFRALLAPPPPGD